MPGIRERPRGKIRYHRPHPLERGLYDDYVGTYKLRPGQVITMTKEHNQLMMQATGQPKVQLFAESERQFFMKEFDVQVSFERDSIGQVIHLTVYDEGQKLPAVKFAPLVLSTDEPTEYTGNYYSEELGTTYTVVVKDGQLVAQQRRHEDIEFMPEEKDEFLSFLGQVKFMREKSKGITGLTVSNERVRHVRFDKQPP
jgi:hypothetical protein